MALLTWRLLRAVESTLLVVYIRSNLVRGAERGDEMTRAPASVRE